MSAEASRRWRKAHPEAVREQRSRHAMTRGAKIRGMRAHDANMAAELARRDSMPPWVFEAMGNLRALRSKQVTREWVAGNRQRVYAHAKAASALRRGSPDGKITAAEWSARLDEFDNRCAYCLSKGHMSQDHIEPVSRGGRHVIDNVIPACRSCNSRKKDHGILRMVMS